VEEETSQIAELQAKVRKVARNSKVDIRAGKVDLCVERVDTLGAHVFL